MSTRIVLHTGCVFDLAQAQTYKYLCLIIDLLLFLHDILLFRHATTLETISVFLFLHCSTSKSPQNNLFLIFQKVSFETGKALADEFSIKFFETSAKINFGVDTAFMSIARYAKLCFFNAYFCQFILIRCMFCSVHFGLSVHTKTNL